MKNFEGMRKLQVGGRALLISSFLSVVSILASTGKLSAQETVTISDKENKTANTGYIKPEEVEGVFINLANDFAEKQKMFESGEGKVVSPNQSMQFEKEGSSYFFIHPQTGEKFIASFTVDENNSGILILDLKDGKGSFLFSKSFTLPRTEELVSLLEGFNKEDTSFEAFKNLGFNFIFKSNPKEGTSYRGGEASVLEEQQNRAYLGGMGLHNK